MANQHDGKIICKTCNGNGYVEKKIYSEYEDKTEMCPDCFWQGEIEKNKNA